MAYNLFIAYDLIPPGQNYEAVQNAIMSLGPWHYVQYSLFYVHTSKSPHEAHAIVWSAMDAGDRLAVINADGAVLTPALQAEIDAINRVWFSQAA